MDWVEAVREYRQSLTLRNFAPRSVERYVEPLEVFRVFMDEMAIPDLTVVSKENIRDFQAHVYERMTPQGLPLCAATQNQYLRSVKCFFRYLREENYLVGDPAREIAYAKEPQKLPRSILTAAEMKKILAAPDTTTLLGYRDRAILEVLYSTGIRSEECNQLLVTDVDYQEGFLRVNAGKGKRDRVVPLGKIACRYLENYIKAVRPKLTRNPANPRLFVSMRGNGFTKAVLLQAVKRYVRKAGLAKRISTHTFRHTCATLMMKNKANIRHIQELLGHASLETTQVYTAVTIADLKEAHKKFHPRERGRGLE